MTQELLTALGGSSEFGIRNSELPGGEGTQACHSEPVTDVTGVGIRSLSPETREADCHGPAALAMTGEETEGRIATASVSTGLAMTDNSEFLRAHFDRLCAAGEALGREFQDFDLSAALHDPEFLRLTAPGLGVDPRRAWLALHPEEVQRRAAADSAAALARSLASGAQRPREGGGQGGSTLETDYRRLPRSEQQRLKQRIYDAAALGEKIYP